MYRRYAAAAFVLVLFYVYDPATTAWFPSCPFRALTGWLCPLCGSLRAVHALVHGHIVDAFLLNPFVFIIGVVSVATVSCRRLQPVRLKPDATYLFVGSAFRRTDTIVAAAAIVFTVVRNLP